MSDQAIPELFGRCLKRERTRLGWSTRAVAARAGNMAISTISRAEHGHEIWLSTAVKIAAALGLTLEQMVTPPACDICGDSPPPGFTCNDCGKTVEAA